MKKLFLIPLLASFFLAPFAYAEDTSWHPYSLGIDYVKSKGIMVGDPDGTFRPDDPINRAELMKVLMESRFSGQSTGGGCFPDVRQEWFSKYVCTARNKGIVEGYPDGKFKPGDPVNFVESLKMIEGAYGYSITPDSSKWYKPYVQAIDRDMMIPDMIYGYGKQITRADVAEMITRFDKKNDGSLYDHLMGVSRMGMIYPNTYEMMEGGSFWVWSEDWGEYGSTVLTGYAVTDIEDIWGETVTRTYFATQSSDQQGFLDYFNGLVDQGNTINKKEDSNLLFALGTGSNPDSFSSTADVPWKTLESLFVSSASNPMKIRVVIPVNLGGMGAPANFTYAYSFSEE